MALSPPSLVSRAGLSQLKYTLHYLKECSWARLSLNGRVPDGVGWLNPTVTLARANWLYSSKPLKHGLNF